MVIKESITNIVCYSKAIQVEILIYTEAKKLVIEINDDGLGILFRTVSTNVGLRSIRERIRNLNGTTAIQSKYPHGTNLTAKIAIADQSLGSRA